MALTKFSTRERLGGAFRLSLLSFVLLAGAPARAEEPNLWDKMMSSVGAGGKPDAASSSQPQAPAAAPAPQQAAPQAATPPPPPAAASVASAPAPTQPPGMWDRMMGTVGLGAKPDAATIDYRERQKLAVPQQRDLPPPNPAPEARVTRPADNEEALTRPPGEYLQKVTGADGHVSGLRDGDTAKEKKFFGMF